MIQNYISSDIIIAKVLADLDIQEEGQRVTDMREWIFEAIEKVGAITQYQHKESGVDGDPILKIRNYQASLPVDLHSILTVAYSQKETGPWAIMQSMTGSFKGSSTSNLAKGHRNITQYSETPQYFIKPGYIATNKKDGFIKMAYTVIYCDDRGYPMVPNTAAFQEAIYWYVVMKLKYPEFLAGRLPENRYFYAERKWSFHRKQAYAEAIMPNEGEMISIKNNWLRLVPEVRSEDTFFSKNVDGEHLWNHNRNIV